MRIVIDMQGAQSSFSGHRGVGRYTRNLATALLANPRGHEIIFAFNAALYEGKIQEMNVLHGELRAVSPHAKLRFWQQTYDSAAINPLNATRDVAAQVSREGFLNSLSPDVIFSTNLQEGLFDPAPTSVKRLATQSGFCSTLHDLTPLRFREHYLSDPQIRRWYEEKIDFAKQSDLILTVSEHSGQDIQEILGVPEQKIGVVYNAVDRQRFNPIKLKEQQASTLLNRYAIPSGFILYTGGSDRHKNLSRLFAAYAGLPVSLRKKHKLVMVGKNLEESLEQFLREQPMHNLSQDIIFPGFVHDDDLASLYSLCSLFIFPSLYEGFGLPALEAMACGAPVIASNTSSLPEVVGLAEAMFNPNDIASIRQKMEQALTDPHLREQLRINAENQVERFSWQKSANTLLDLFEAHFDERVKQISDPIEQIISAIAASPLAHQLNDVDLDAISVSIEQSIPPSGRTNKLFLDVSALIQTNDHTGIQRVTRALAQQLRKHPLGELETHLVYTQPDDSQFYVAGSLIDRFDANASCTTNPTPVEFYAGDVLLFLDLHPRVAIRWQPRLQRLRQRGIKTYHLVYDLIPHTHPQFFWPDLCNEFEAWLDAVCQSDGAICISKSVAQDLSDWTLRQEKHHSFSRIGWFHLGADLENSVPTTTLDENAETFLARLGQRTTFLMVGTIEPRKGHAQTLDAFEVLWKKGVDTDLLIIGKQGWGTETLAQRIQQHNEFGKRLFWFLNASDEFLKRVYTQADALIAASYTEGFGLPLIEAARQNIHLIARDIPVFREVAGDHAHYFAADTPQDLADAIQGWLDLYQKGETPKSSAIHWLTWEQSAQALKQQLIQLGGLTP